MTEKQHNIIHLLMIVPFVALSVMLYLSMHTPEPEPTVEIVTDTVFLHSTDTLFVSKENIRYKEIKVTDTIFIRDTFLIRESRTYEDSLASIYISGINPSLDSIRYYIPRDTIKINTEIKETIVKQKHWSQFIGIGAGVGYGVNIAPQPSFSPNISISLIYGFGYTF